MGKGLVLPVNVREKMLRALGQVQNRLQVDDLRGRGRDGGIKLRQPFQIPCFQIPHFVPPCFLLSIQYSL